ncbi:hypothetical protein Cgig2_001661 [Carnegiea gigantea]|uniref:Uncharacterized protein n=1 Tax=Carnegiea gigantea TaxID=171969 RepID=A0A9Q1JYN0_9CARY|nr:hypothetical protein Cgig2_001661 [Carnegiea gigantea]
MITGHPNLYREQLRLPRDLFIELVHIICEKKLMSNGHFIEVTEISWNMLVYFIKRSKLLRNSGKISTINEVLVTLLVDVIRSYDSVDEVPYEISNNGGYRLFFRVYNFVSKRKLSNSYTIFINIHLLKELSQGCVGALDETHIQAIILDKDGTSYQNRKGKRPGVSWAYAHLT